MTPLEELREAVEALGGSIHLWQFEAGQTVVVRLPGKPPKFFDSQWGETPAAVKALRAIKPH